jgi:hypothetical protein
MSKKLPCIRVFRGMVRLASSSGDVVFVSDCGVSLQYRCSIILSSSQKVLGELGDSNMVCQWRKVEDAISSVERHRNGDVGAMFGFNEAQNSYHSKSRKLRHDRKSTQERAEGCWY